MRSRKETWYRTGSAANLLGISQHRLRQLARASLIEFEERNGYFYVPAREIERLKRDGIPPVPASADLGEEPRDQTETGEAGESPRQQRSRVAPELYAEPSSALALSKEKVIRLEHSVEARRLKQQMTEMNRAAREEQERAKQARLAGEWRQRYIRRAAVSVPGEICADVCSRIERLLDSVPPFSDVSRQVADVIGNALRPIRQREEQTRALESHGRRISNAIQSIGLPYEATHDEREEARDLARRALQSFSMGSSDRELRMVIAETIQPILDRIKQRQAEATRRQLEANHRNDINRMVAFVGLSLAGGTLQNDELSRVQAIVHSALETASVGATWQQMNAVMEEAMRPVNAEIQLRKSVRSEIGAALRDQEKSGGIEFADYLSFQVMADRLADEIGPQVRTRIGEPGALSESQFKARITHLVREHCRKIRNGRRKDR